MQYSGDFVISNSSTVLCTYKGDFVVCEFFSIPDDYVFAIFMDKVEADRVFKSLGSLVKGMFVKNAELL